MTSERRQLWRVLTKTSTEDGNPVLFVEGRLGHAGAAELEATLLQKSHGAANLVIDLSEVDYISSAALKVFEAIAGRQSQQGGRLVLRAPSVAARLSLELSGLLALAGSASDAVDR